MDELKGDMWGLVIEDCLQEIADWGRSKMDSLRACGSGRRDSAASIDVAGLSPQFGFI